MIDNKYLEPYEGTPRGIKASVHHDKFRLEKAEEEAKKKVVGIEKIIEFTNQFLKAMSFESNECININIKDVDYIEIQNKHKLNDIRDIVWMKFTKDGYLGVVATSNDINYDIPQSKEGYNSRWKYNTSGIIINHLNKEWDENFVLIFPLKSINNISRGVIERGIGNYLISKGVPILDFYSHNY